jgi:NAD(P)-dependent dehydrogenase (short-subunit alcohol dehydrogenase family)
MPKIQQPDLSSRIAVLTGASRGLGRATALTLAAHGAQVVLVARSLEGLAETARLISSQGGRAMVIQTDLSDLNAVAALQARLETDLGKPDILINAAGMFGPIGLFKDTDPQAWLETIRVNTLMPYLLCRAFVGSMLERGWGRIVNFSSAAALHTPGPLNSAYGTSKVALNQMTRHLAAELEGSGVTANVIHPGDVKTEMWAEIRHKVNQIEGAAGESYRHWAAWVAETGGDDPQKAADLVLNLMREEAASLNGRFLWIEDGLQAPIPSWGEALKRLPWQTKAHPKTSS